MTSSSKYPGATRSFSKILNAFSLGPDNLQSEDCLTLNVWSKAHQGQKKAVLVWLYGGGQFRLVVCRVFFPLLLIFGDLAFRIGTTNTAFYQGQYIAAAQDIVFVSVKYVFQPSSKEWSLTSLLNVKLSYQYLRLLRRPWRNSKRWTSRPTKSR